jgi:hypothetical protein
VSRASIYGEVSAERGDTTVLRPCKNAAQADRALEAGIVCRESTYARSTGLARIEVVDVSGSLFNTGDQARVRGSIDMHQQVRHYLNWITLHRTYRTWAELKGDATIIVVGVAGAQKVTLAPFRPGSQTLIPDRTTTQIQVEQVWLEHIRSRKALNVGQFGGISADGVTSKVEGFPVLERGKRYLLFLAYNNVMRSFWTIGMYQGAFTVDDADQVSAISVLAARTGVGAHNVPLDEVRCEITNTR